MVSLDHPVFVGLKNAGSRFFDLDHPVITLGSPHGSHLFIDFSVTLDVLEMHIYDTYIYVFNLNSGTCLEHPKPFPRRIVPCDVFRVRIFSTTQIEATLPNCLTQTVR